MKALLNITDIYGLEQLINEPTRITPTTSTLIDLIFTNRPENVVRGKERKGTLFKCLVVLALER